MKTIIKIFICLSLIYTPMFANAANVGGWNLSNPVAQGASTVYDATKNVLINGKDFVKKSTVKITPTASGVAKVLARGGAGYALSVAVEQLLGAVDWVLDPANNQIKYTDPTSTPVGKSFNVGNKYYNSISEACNDAAALSGLSWNSGSDRAVRYYYGGFGASTYTFPGYSKLDSISCLLSNTGSATAMYVNNPAHTENEQKTLPLPVVAAQVISNAESDTDKRAAAQVATTAAATDIVNDAETDNIKASPIVTQLESAAQTATDETATGETTKPNTSDPTAPPEVTNISLEFPVFCGWAPTVCEAAQVVITFPTTLTNWWDTSTQAISASWTTFKDWAFADDALPESTAPVIDSIPTPEIKEDAISWTASCPPDAQIPISLQGVSTTLVLSWSPWCQLLSMIKPAIVASAYIGAAFIVLGLRT